MQGNGREEQIRKFLTLFGLAYDYTSDELTGAYRTLAKLNHPDVNRDVTSEMRMTIINEGYRFLQENLKHQKTGGETAHPVQDPAYLCYREAFRMLKNAFEEYFGEVEDRSLMGNLQRLRERLMSAKRGFSRLVNEMPYNEWVDDAIDKINSINKWLD